MRSVETITLVIADPTPILSESLAIALSLQPDIEVLGERPQNGPATVEALIRLKPTVALIDFWMPEIDGPTVSGTVSEQITQCKIILFSWLCGPAQIAQSLQSGAVGLLPKDCRVGDVAEVIRRTASGEVPLNTAKHVSTLVERQLGRRQDLAQFLRLTSREVEILALLNKGRTTREISNRLSISPKTVSNHIFEIMGKTETHSQVELLAKARESGFLKS